MDTTRRAASQPAFYYTWEFDPKVFAAAAAAAAATKFVKSISLPHANMKKNNNKLTLP